MKRMLLLVMLSFMAQMFSATYTVDGYAFLEGETDHSGIEVFFQRVVPDTLYSYTIHTDSTGYYSSNIEGGWYDVEYSKSGHYPVITEDVALYLDQTLGDKTLSVIPTGLYGSISGVLEQGVYNVISTITVEAGDSLIIEPGVMLNFVSTANFDVYGYLKAEGTKIDSIYFNPINDTWGGLGFGYTSSVTIKNCSINSAQRAIELSGITNASISNIDINLSDYGIYVHSYVNCKLKKIKISGNSSRGVYISNYYNTIEISDSEIVGYAFGIDCVHLNNLKLYNVLIQSSDRGINAPDINCIIVNSCIIGFGFYGIFGNELFEIKSSNVYGFDHNYYDCNPYIGVNVTTNENGDPCDAYGNISMDPRFVDAANGDFRLQSDSPCIDAGTNTIAGYVFPVADLAGNYRIWDGNGNGSTIVDLGPYEYGAPSGIEGDPVTIQDCQLFQNYPNPFNPVTTISYALPKAAQVELNIFNMNGQLVQSLVNGRQEKGIHKAEFNAGDLTSGLYIYNLKADGKVVQSRKMMLLK